MPKQISKRRELKAIGTLSGFLANKLLTPPAEVEESAAVAEPAEAPEPAATPADSNDPKSRIAELKRMLEAQEQAMADLRVKLQDFDESL